MASVNKKRKISACFDGTKAKSVEELEQRVKQLEEQVAAERDTRYRLAAQHAINPDPEKGLLDALPVDIVAMILDQLLVKPHLLSLNDLLCRPEVENTTHLDGYHLSVRQGIGGHDFRDLQEMKTHHRLSGTFSFDSKTDRWQWTTSSEFFEMWNVLNTCKIFREIGLPILLSKNTWIVNPAFGLTKTRVQRYWCVRLGHYKGPWTGDNGLGDQGVPRHLMLDFALEDRFPMGTGGHYLTSQEVVRDLPKRELRSQEFITVPKALLEMPDPLRYIKHICIGLPLKYHIPSDAVHFLTETIQFVNTYREFSKLETVLLKLGNSWRASFEDDWGCRGMKDDTVVALSKALANHPIWCKSSIEMDDNDADADDEELEQLQTAFEKASAPGTRALYPKVALANTAANDFAIFLKNGHVRTVVWPTASDSDDGNEVAGHDT